MFEGRLLQIPAGSLKKQRKNLHDQQYKSTDKVQNLIQFLKTTASQNSFHELFEA